jgi:predicted DNA-binding transcriptional regulator AlpA
MTDALQTYASTSGGNVPTQGFIRLPQVLAVFPVSRSTWWAGVKTGRFPAPVRLGPRTVAWKVSEILALIEGLADSSRMSAK